MIAKRCPSSAAAAVAVAHPNLMMMSWSRGEGGDWRRSVLPCDDRPRQIGEPISDEAERGRERDAGPPKGNRIPRILP